MPGANGVFVIAPLGGAAAARIAALQRRYDPKLAGESPPHVTLVGSSGAGPIAPTASRAAVEAALAPVLAAAAPLALPFGRPERFPGTNVVALPLSPHGPLRTLHDQLVAALAAHGVPRARGRFTFTPHATLSFYPTLAPAALRALLAERFDEPAVIDRVEVSYTRSPQPPVRWFEVALGGPAPGAQLPGGPAGGRLPQPGQPAEDA